jgi:uroporphyrinogen-III synthase
MGMNALARNRRATKNVSYVASERARSARLTELDAIAVRVSVIHVYRVLPATVMHWLEYAA